MKTEADFENGSFEKKLLAITNGCRKDMHEPDEQGLSAGVIGTELNNAFGDTLILKALEGGYQEMLVILRRDEYSPDIHEVGYFNLATLIAYAKLAIENGLILD